jgi:hypothetical protein
LLRVFDDLLVAELLFDFVPESRNVAAAILRMLNHVMEGENPACPDKGGISEKVAFYSFICVITINKKKVQWLSDALDLGEDLFWMRVAANQVRGLKLLTERTIQKGVDCAVSATELTTREINADYLGSGRRKTAKHAQSATFKGADLHHLLRAERGDYVGEVVKLRRNLQRLNQIVGQHKGCNSLGRGLETQPKHKRDSGSSAAEFC